MKAASQAGRPLALWPPRDGHNVILSTSRPIVLPLNPGITRAAAAPRISKRRLAGSAAGGAQWTGPPLFAPPSPLLAAPLPD